MNGSVEVLTCAALPACTLRSRELGVNERAISIANMLGAVDRPGRTPISRQGHGFDSLKLLPQDAPPARFHYILFYHPSGLAALKGQRLDGERLATNFQATLPPAVRSVTSFAERSGDGIGFIMTVGFVAGQVSGQTGWNREMSVRCRNKSLYNQSGYVSEGGMDAENIYRGIKNAFERAIQMELDAPVIVHFRLQRSGVH